MTKQKITKEKEEKIQRVNLLRHIRSCNSDELQDIKELEDFVGMSLGGRFH